METSLWVKANPFPARLCASFTLIREIDLIESTDASSRQSVKGTEGKHQTGENLIRLLDVVTPHRPQHTVIKCNVPLRIRSTSKTDWIKKTNLSISLNDWGRFAAKKLVHKEAAGRTNHIN